MTQPTISFPDVPSTDLSFSFCLDSITRTPFENQRLYIPMSEKHTLMNSFPPEKLSDLKHVIYNLLVQSHNNPSFKFIEQITIESNGIIRTGFRFNVNENPDKKLAELYAKHIRKGQLDRENINSVFIQDLYKYYLRAVLELLSKYFEKKGKYTYLYEETPLFIPNGSLEDAEQRIKHMKSRARKRVNILQPLKNGLFCFFGEALEGVEETRCPEMQEEVVQVVNVVLLGWFEVEVH